MAMAMGSGCLGQGVGQGFARRGAWPFSAFLGGALSLVHEFIFKVSFGTRVTLLLAFGTSRALVFESCSYYGS